jgi:hypothetical protein
MERGDSAYMVIIHVLHIGFISNLLLSITISRIPRRDGLEWCLETEETVPHNGHTSKNGSRRVQQKVVKGTDTFWEIIAWRRWYVSTEPNLRKFIIKASRRHVITL